MLEGFCADNLADRGYDNDDTLACAEKMGALAVIPQRKIEKSSKRPRNVGEDNMTTLSKAVSADVIEKEYATKGV